MEIDISNDNQATDDIPLIDGFEMIKRLGESATSSVWKARQISLGRTVILKILSKHHSNDPEDVKQFRFEAKVAANLKHPGIVQVYDFGRSKHTDRYYFVMEYITGYSIGEWLRRKGSLSESDSIIIAHCVADALQFAWDQSRIIHCDIKPDNIMVDGDGTIKVTDMGLAKAVSTISAYSDSVDEMMIMGTPNYMSPEQARGEESLDCRTDIYGLGMTLYHLLTGVLPFDEREESRVMERQIIETLEYPQKIVPDLSTGISRLIVKMTAKSPEERHQHWAEALNEIIPLENRILSAKRRHEPPEEKRDISSETIPIRVAGEAYDALPKTTKKKVKLRLRTQPRDEQERITASVPMKAERKRRRASSLWGNLRVVASVALIIFIVYYGYNRLVNQRDIILPLRIKIYRDVIPAWNRFQWKVKTIQEIRTIAEDRGAEDEGFKEILRMCENERPRTGSHISVELKNRPETVIGIIEQFNPHGIVVRVKAGIVVCPFAVMEEETRLLFSPEERARKIWQERKAD